MKKTILITSLLIFVFISCGPTQDDAIKYNNLLIDIQENLTDKQNLFVNQLDGHNVDSLKITHQLFVQQAEISSVEFAKIKKFEGKSEFGKTASDFFATMKSIVNNEGKEMVVLLSKDDDQYTEEDNEDLKRLAINFDEQYKKAFEKFHQAQIAFAKKWNFELISNRNF